MNRKLLSLGRGLPALFVLALTACGTDAPPPPPPAGDAGSDAGPVEEDAGPAEDAGVDAGPAVEDAGPPDAPMDAGPPPECTADGDCDDGDTCNGTEGCGADGNCVDGTALAEGSTCDADAMPTTRDLCVGGACGATRCGDGFTDTTTTEECDDGNDVLGDGCDDCRFTCAAAADCADTETCNGTETCTAAHVCAPGTSLPNGTACAGSTGRCAAGTCLPNTCTTAAGCQDGDMCNGAEICGATGCGTGPLTDCDDADPCTADGCVSATGCTHTLIDADRDGFAPASLGACGMDCDDTRGDVNPSATELCGNGRDDDCDGMTDEVGVTTWYADCDGDGFASAGARMLDACATPASGLSMCTTGGGWTARSPATAATSDCNDGNASVNPGQSTFQTTAIAGAPAASDFDYDCSGMEERRVTTIGACMRSGLSCVLTEGWSGGTAPVCGATAPWITACAASALTCNATTEMRQQACR